MVKRPGGGDSTTDPAWGNARDIEIIRSRKPERRFLVYVCAGQRDNRRCLLENLGSRQFDLATRYYCTPNDNDELAKQSEHLLTGGLSKFHSAKPFLERTGFHRAYDFVVFLDEDIDISVEQMNDFLFLAKLLKFDLVQPALSADSAASWPITLWHPSFAWRETNFVEVMMPCLSRKALAALLETFDKSISSYGLDFLWPLLLKNTGARIGIIDMIVVGHRKSIDRSGGAFYKYLKSLGIKPFEERSELRRSYRIKFEPPRILGGLQTSDIPKFLRRRMKRPFDQTNVLVRYLIKHVDRAGTAALEELGHDWTADQDE